MKFDQEFVWGTATAAYQIEGAIAEDGKGLSIWDTFTSESDNIYNGDTGAFACDSYNKIEEDVQLLKALGVQAYRFSIAWTRILPQGIGPVNQQGIDFYNRLIDELLAHDIEPYITLFHWDYPYALHKKGHWLNPSASDWFQQYADIVTKAFGDRVKHWMTFNEPQVFVGYGYRQGHHAPGYQLEQKELIQMAHNILLSHGKAVKMIRKNVDEPIIGVAFVGDVGIPNTDSAEDIQAAKDYMFDGYHHAENPEDYDFTFDNDLWFDPIFLGEYPEWVDRDFGQWLPKDYKNDLEIISQSIDFMGLNIYFGHRVESSADGFKMSQLKEGHAVTGIDWVVSEASLYWGPLLMHERYNHPIMITENGLSNKDWVFLDGKVHDYARIDFLTRYLRQLYHAKEDGAEITGYFHWSLMDNFEWADGYRERFGLVHVDFATGKRTKKDSYYWYRDIVQGKQDF